MKKYVKVLAIVPVSILAIALPVFGQIYNRVNGTVNLPTIPDSNDTTFCPNGFMITGLAGGFGHSSKYNNPHLIKCDRLINASGVGVTFTGDYDTRQTLVDDNTMTHCPSNYVMVGLSGGWGHSSSYNAPHKFSCRALSNNFQIANNFRMQTKVESDEITVCPTGFVVIGLSGGYGHSSEYNVPHDLLCGEILPR
jgi:hypothetical protein